MPYCVSIESCILCFMFCAAHLSHMCLKSVSHVLCLASCICLACSSHSVYRISVSLCLSHFCLTLSLALSCILCVTFLSPHCLLCLPPSSFLFHACFSLSLSSSLPPSSPTSLLPPPPPLSLAQDMINRRVSMRMMLQFAKEQEHKQFIFFTPQDMRYCN